MAVLSPVADTSIMFTILISVSFLYDNSVYFTTLYTYDSTRELSVMKREVTLCIWSENYLIQYLGYAYLYRDLGKTGKVILKIITTGLKVKE